MGWRFGLPEALSSDQFEPVDMDAEQRREVLDMFRAAGVDLEDEGEIGTDEVKPPPFAVPTQAFNRASNGVLQRFRPTGKVSGSAWTPPAAWRPSTKLGDAFP